MAVEVLVGYQAAAARYLPFARAVHQQMLGQLAIAPASVPVRHIPVDGAQIDIWADRFGGRIVITAQPGGEIREFGSVTTAWRLFSKDTLTEIEASRVTLLDLGGLTAYTPEDATVRGFLMSESVSIDSVFHTRYALHGLSAHRVWASDYRQSVPPHPQTFPPRWNSLYESFTTAGGQCFAGNDAVFVDGWTSKHYPLYANPAIDDLTITGYQHYDATLRYVRLSMDDGSILAEAPTREAVVWGALEPVFVPHALAGAFPVASSFHAIGTRYTQGTDADTDRLVVAGYEIHHVDTETLTLLAAESLPAAPLSFGAGALIVDETGTVYVVFSNPGGLTYRLDAYTRDLARDTAKDFADIPNDFPASYRFVVRGEFVYARVSDPGGSPVQFKKFDRAGALLATEDVSTLGASTNTALALLRQ